MSLINRPPPPPLWHSWPTTPWLSPTPCKSEWRCTNFLNISIKPTPPFRNLLILKEKLHLWSNLQTLHSFLWHSLLQYLRHQEILFQHLAGGVLFHLDLKHLATLHSVQVFRSTPSDASWTKQSWITTIQSWYLVLITFGWKIYLSASPAYSSCLCLNIGTCLAPVCPYPLGLFRKMSTFVVGSNLQPKKSHHDQVIKSHSWIQLGPVHWHSLQAY